MGAGVDRSVAIVEIALVLPQLMHLLLLLYSDGIHVLPRASAVTHAQRSRASAHSTTDVTARRRDLGRQQA